MGFLKSNTAKKKNTRSLFYRISAWLHLWLGLVTGIIVVIVCLTGCIWVFQEEITGILEPETRITHRNQAVLTPSQLQEVAWQHYPGKKVSYASYQMGRAIYLGVGEGRRGGTTMRINPYTGEVISIKERKQGETDFFRFILNGHRFLWLPWKIGRPVVNYSILIFVVTLITGLVLWWPKKWNKSTRDKSFRIKWNGTVKRINYDLHNVLGFYSLLILFAIACTGIVYGIEWFSKGLYWTTSGGQSLPKPERVQSDSLQAGLHYTPEQAMDLAWQKVLEAHPDAQGFYYGFPDTARAGSTISMYIYPTAGKYYNNRNYVFDQHTLTRLPGYALSGKDFSESTFGEKLRRMNYDIHIGSILGLTGKFIAFFASLIGATLPVTGFVIWWGKKKKRPKEGKGSRIGNKSGPGKTGNQGFTRIYQRRRPGEEASWPEPVLGRPE